LAERSPDRKTGTGTIGLFVIAFLLGIAYVVWLAAGAQGGEPAPTVAAPDTFAFVGPTRTLRPTRTPEPVPTPEPLFSPTVPPDELRIGIVAGHWQSDSGATCPDGLREVDINLAVAARVVSRLQQDGFQVDLMPEFAPTLDGYKADAFVSIHADSCDVPGVSGFKVAGVASSAIPEEDDLLVFCLSREYANATGLRFHIDSITFDMTDYHAFKEIDPETPGAIIELGFMDADRELLTQHTSELAEAVVQGLVCFLQGN
jgi:N-acetylmuramoyl-L-alanine amidase